MIPEELKEAYQDGNLALYLGAGVSVESRIPDWKKLVIMMSFKRNEELMAESRKSPYPNYLYAISQWVIENNEDSLDTIISKLNRHYSKDQFIGIIRETLYESITSSAPGDSLTQIPRDIIRKNSTLQSIVKLCKDSRVKEKGVSSVITYNYDNLLESALKWIESDSFESIIRGDLQTTPGKIPIYHVHGYIPFRAINDGIQMEQLVFGEESYHLTAQDAYYWGNIVQMKTLMSEVGLMIGLSLTDRNLRRILLALKNAPVTKKNYLIYTKPDILEGRTLERAIKEVRKKALDYLEDFDEAKIKEEIQREDAYLAKIFDLVMKQKYRQSIMELKDFGVTPIEVNNHSEIREICDEIIG